MPCSIWTLKPWSNYAPWPSRLILGICAGGSVLLWMRRQKLIERGILARFWNWRFCAWRMPLAPWRCLNCWGICRGAVRRLDPRATARQLGRRTRAVLNQAALQVPAVNKDLLGVPVLTRAALKVLAFNKGLLKVPVLNKGLLKVPVLNKDHLRVPVLNKGRLRVPVLNKGLLRVPVLNKGLLRVPVLTRAALKDLVLTRVALKVPPRNRGHLSALRFRILPKPWVCVIPVPSKLRVISNKARLRVLSFCMQ